MDVVRFDTESQWLAARKCIITGRGAAAIDAWGQEAADLARVMAGLAEAPNLDWNWRVALGKQEEEPLAQWLGSRYAARVEDPGRTTLVYHPENRLHACSLDRLMHDAWGYGSAIVAELKTTKTENKRFWRGEPARSAWVQLQWQLYCTQLRVGVVAVAFLNANSGKLEGRERFQVSYDEKFIRGLLPKVEGFLNLVHGLRCTR